MAPFTLPELVLVVVLEIGRWLHPHDARRLELALLPNREVDWWLLLTGDPYFANVSLRRLLALELDPRNIDASAQRLPTEASVLGSLHLYQLGACYIAAALSLAPDDLEFRHAFPGDLTPGPCSFPWVRRDPAPIVAGLRLLEERDPTAFAAIGSADWFLLSDEDELFARWIAFGVDKEPQRRVDSSKLYNLCSRWNAPRCMRRLLAAGEPVSAGTLLDAAVMADFGLLMEVVEAVRAEVAGPSGTWAGRGAVSVDAIDDAAANVVIMCPWGLAEALLTSGIVLNGGIDDALRKAVIRGAGEETVENLIEFCRARGLDTRGGVWARTNVAGGMLRGGVGVLRLALREMDARGLPRSVAINHACRAALKEDDMRNFFLLYELFPDLFMDFIEVETAKLRAVATADES